MPSYVRGKRTNQVSIPSNSTDEVVLNTLRKHVSTPIKNLKIPPFAATNSLIQNDIDITPTQVYKTPLIPGPASCYNAIYTALIRAQGINTWSCGSNGPTIVSLDLDLYEKVYKLVNSRDDMRGRFIPRLGELHAVFAHVRAIGQFISNSGLEDAWVEAEWFDSDAVVRQVIECKHMKRAVEAHEETLVAIEILQLIEMLKTSPEYFCEYANDLIQIVSDLNNAMSDKKYSTLKEMFYKFQILMSNMDLKQKWDSFRESKVNNLQFHFFTIYTNMVKRLLEFIQASRTRNWPQHLSAGEALMKDFISMDRIKYRKGWLVYIADMKNLEENNKEVWEYFMKGYFSVQKSSIPGVALGCDHAGEQVNCEDKSRGGLKGITRNVNARTRHYLAAPIVDQIANEMMTRGQANTSTSQSHHQLKDPVISRQNVRILKLVSVLQQGDLGLDKAENPSIRNLITGKVFAKEVCEQVVSCEEKGQKIYEAMIEERLKPNSVVKVFDPVKKLLLNTLKKASKTNHIKLKDREIRLGDDANIWRKIAIVSNSRDIDYNDIIGNYELSVTPQSLMDAKRNLHDGGQGKSKLIEVIKASDDYRSSIRCPDNVQCVVFDGFCMLKTY